MSARAASWLAWSLAGLWLAMFAASVALFVLVRSADVPNSWNASTVGDAVLFVPFAAFPVVGALIASRRTRNPIGWICLADGLLWMLIVLSEAYTAYGLASPGSVPFLATVNALTYAWLWVPTVGLLGVYLPLLFPDGRLPSRRWRPLAWFSGVVISSISVVVFFTPGPLEGLGGARNPFGVEGIPWLVAAGWIVLPLLPLCMLVSAVSLVLRFRRSAGEVREQIKWIAFAASLMGSLYLTIMCAGAINWLISAPETPSDLGTETLWGALLENVMLLSFAGVPVAIGFAVLKYRLYDINFLINRALVYGALTVMLVGIYLGAVISLQYAFRALTGQETQLAIVVSTLAIAALFNPLRRFVQAFVDRRFYRRKYDARKTLEEFGARLRNETDLESLSDDLVAVVRETVQPSHTSLWLREPERRTREADG
ncbi:MAG: hypothetical protein H0U02_14585 [Rubrobacter sp.]|nr:hypothetical protein [Rubrobacter sp.]